MERVAGLRGRSRGPVLSEAWLLPHPVSTSGHLLSDSSTHLGTVPSPRGQQRSNKGAAQQGRQQDTVQFSLHF